MYYNRITLETLKCREFTPISNNSEVRRCRCKIKTLLMDMDSFDIDQPYQYLAMMNSLLSVIRVFNI